MGLANSLSDRYICRHGFLRPRPLFDKLHRGRQPPTVTCTKAWAICKPGSSWWGSSRQHDALPLSDASCRPVHVHPGSHFPSVFFISQFGERLAHDRLSYPVHVIEFVPPPPPSAMFPPMALKSPTSPVDSAMFPTAYECAATALMSTTSSVDDTLPRTFLRPPKGKSLDFVKVTTMTQELEPLEFRPSHPTPRLQNGSSLSSVFGDQALIDAIMGSLTTELQPTGTNISSRVPRNPMFGPPSRVPSTSFMALMQQCPMPDGRTLTGPCVRKPGTFLNKDGRWIKGKPCHMTGCDKRAQSNGLCKGHGGGARCSFAGCSKSSQGGGFCRAHGGGKRCRHDGCDKGTQRHGFCYLHGGVRSCTVDGCEKKDRGNGKCFSHGGGRKCQAPMCVQTIRRGAFCDGHTGETSETRR